MSSFTKLFNDPVRGLGYIRAIYCLNIIYLLWRFVPNFKTPIAAEHYRPIYLFTFFEAPNAFWWMKIALTILLLIHAGGWLGKVAPALAAVLASMLFGWAYCYGATFYVDSTLILILIAAVILPKVTPESNPQDLRVNLFLMRFLLIYPFFSAAVCKMRNAGWEWTSAENQRRIYQWNLILFREQFSSFSEPVQRYLLRQPWFLHMAGISTLVIEGISPLAFLNRYFAAAIIPALLAIHIGFALILSHNFFMFIWPLYLYWLPWKQSNTSLSRRE